MKLTAIIPKPVPEKLVLEMSLHEANILLSVLGKVGGYAEEGGFRMSFLTPLYKELTNYVGESKYIKSITGTLYCLK